MRRYSQRNQLNEQQISRTQQLAGIRNENGNLINESTDRLEERLDSNAQALYRVLKEEGLEHKAKRALRKL